MLEQDKLRERRSPTPAVLSGRPARSRLGGDGRIVIPAPMREALNLKEGDTVVLRIENGELRMSPMAAVTQRVRALVRKLVPPGTPLVDQLIAERRREAHDE